jgi:hypothetical protein
MVKQIIVLISAWYNIEVFQEMLCCNFLFLVLMPNLKQQEDDLSLIVSPNPGFDETSVSYFLNINKRKSRKKSIISDKKKVCTKYSHYTCSFKFISLTYRHQIKKNHVVLWKMFPSILPSPFVAKNIAWSKRQCYDRCVLYIHM